MVLDSFSFSRLHHAAETQRLVLMSLLSYVQMYTRRTNASHVRIQHSIVYSTLKTHVKHTKM